jgi:hypothetical protein
VSGVLLRPGVRALLDRLRLPIIAEPDLSTLVDLLHPGDGGVC